MSKVITLLITLLFYSTSFTQSSIIDEEKQRLNLIFLDKNNKPIEQTILLKSKSENFTLELKSDVNGVIDTLVPTNNTYVIHLVNESDKAAIDSGDKHSQILGILSLALKFMIKEKE